MGGRGTWNFAVRYPQYFSAIVPIAGAYKKASREIPANICELKNLPIWTFHGTRDEAVAVWQTQILVDTLRACGSSIRCTIYPDAGHEESWRKAYADPELFTWLFSQTRK
jgi:predicted peptidase